MDRPKLTDLPEQSQTRPGTVTELDPTPDHGERTWMGRKRLTGKRALITGGDSGIGRATAVTFAKEGADVAISFLPEERPDAEETASLVQSVSPPARPGPRSSRRRSPGTR